MTKIDLKKELTALRDDYESTFKTLIDALPLPAHVDKKMLRLMVVGAINSTQLWYRPGEYTPTQIGQEIVSLLRQPLG